MNGYHQLDMFELGAVLRTESDFHATLLEIRNAGLAAPDATSKRTQAQGSGNACPLCKGTMDGDTCTKCGMQVLR